jgi:hypothetical protein
VDDTHCQSFFLKPTDTLHRRYEALRAYFVEHRPPSQIAAQFGLTYGTTCSLIADFHGRKPTLSWTNVRTNYLPVLKSYREVV